jgi:hypothetical protein
LRAHFGARYLTRASGLDVRTYRKERAMFKYEILRVVINRDPDNPQGVPLNVFVGVQILDEAVQSKGVQPLYNEYTISRSQLETRAAGQSDEDFYRSIIDPQARDAHDRWAKANENPPPKPLELSGANAAAALGLNPRVEVKTHEELGTAPTDVPAHAVIAPEDVALREARELLSGGAPAQADQSDTPGAQAEDAPRTGAGVESKQTAAE